MLMHVYVHMCTHDYTLKKYFNTSENPGSEFTELRLRYSKREMYEEDISQHLLVSCFHDNNL